MMRLLAACCLCLLALVLASPGAAQVQGDNRPPQFRDAFEETRFRTLAHELRCVMCQNQSLADSDAQIARDLRQELLLLMREGKTDAEIRDFMVARYGEFVLYKPRLDTHTALLWFGPPLLLLAGGLALFLLLRQQRQAAKRIGNDETQEW